MPLPKPILLLGIMVFCTTVLGWDPPFGISLQSLAKVAFTGFAAMIVLLFIKQDEILYVPRVNPQVGGDSSQNPPNYRSPEEYRIPFEDVWIKTPSGPKIHGWWMPQPKSVSRERPTLVFFHGNAGNIGARLPNWAELYYKVGVNLLGIDYRGYGASDGTPTEAGLLEDGIQTLLWLEGRDDLDHSEVYLFGRSLGGAVAISVTAHLRELREQRIDTLRKMGFRKLLRGPKGVIVENTFLSIAELAPAVLPLLKALMLPTWVLEKLLRNRWKSSAFVKQIDVPILFLSGLKDEIVPASQMEQLHEIARKRFHASSSVDGSPSQEGLVPAVEISSDRESPFMVEEEQKDRDAERRRLLNLLTRIVRFPSGMHNDTFMQGGSAYYEAISEWLARVRRLRFRADLGGGEGERPSSPSSHQGEDGRGEEGEVEDSWSDEGSESEVVDGIVRRRR